MKGREKESESVFGLEEGVCNWCGGCVAIQERDAYVCVCGIRPVETWQLALAHD